MIFFLCGFMGSGKTFFLHKLKANWKEKRNHSSTKIFFYDLDQEILLRFAPTHTSVKTFVEKVGWDDFRECEKKCLWEILNQLNRNPTQEAIISLGGGSLTEETLIWIKGVKEARLIWLTTSFDECYSRILQEGNEHRPMLDRGKDYLEELYLQRKKLYCQSHLQLHGEELEQIHDFFDLVTHQAKDHNKRKATS